MSEEGYLRLLPTGRWAVVRFGHDPVEITSGDLVRVEVDGCLLVTQIEFRHFDDETRARRGTHGEYYSVHGYALRQGLPAAIGAGETDEDDGPPW